MAIAWDRNFPASLDEVPMIILFRTVVGAAALAGCGLMSASAHAVSPSRPKEPVDITSIDAYRISSPTEHPELTPEELGRRTLRLLDGLKSMDELTVGQVSARTGIPLEYAPKGKVYAFTVQIPDSPWYYGVNYREGLEGKLFELEYAYVGDARPKGAPLCGMSADGLARKLKADGYSLWIDVDELGQALAYYFERSPLKVRVVPGASVPNEKTGAYHMCVSQLMITSAD